MSARELLGSGNTGDFVLVGNSGSRRAGVAHPGLFNRTSDSWRQKKNEGEKERRQFGANATQN